MSSWVRCTCGKLNHKNLFAAENVHVVIADELLNKFGGKSADEAVAAIIRDGEVLVRCSCGRIAIEDKTGQITIYAPEQ